MKFPDPAWVGAGRFQSALELWGELVWPKVRHLPEASRSRLESACRELIEPLFHVGADPGLCLLDAERESPDALDFARRAQIEIVTMNEALVLGRAAPTSTVDPTP